MKNRGIIRSVDALGRIVIPIEVRRMLGIGAGRELELTVDGDRLIYKKAGTSALRDAIGSALCALEENGGAGSEQIAAKLREALALIGEE